MSPSSIRPAGAARAACHARSVGDRGAAGGERARTMRRRARSEPRHGRAGDPGAPCGTVPDADARRACRRMPTCSARRTGSLSSADQRPAPPRADRHSSRRGAARRRRPASSAPTTCTSSRGPGRRDGDGDLSIAARGAGPRRGWRAATWISAAVEAMMRVKRPTSMIVTAGGEQQIAARASRGCCRSSSACFCSSA